MAKHCHTRQSEAKETHVSLTRKMLKAFGIEEDTIEQIIEAHTETTDSLKAERDRYKQESQRVKELEEELEKAKAQVKEASDTTEYDELKSKYDEEHKELEELRKSGKKLQDDFDAYKNDIAERDAKRAKTNAYRELLVKAGIAQKYMGPVMKVADVSKIELEDDGSVKDQDALIEGVKADWAEFIPKKETKGADPENPPKVGSAPKGANPRAVQIAKERRERLYGKSEE